MAATGSHWRYLIAASAVILLASTACSSRGEPSTDPTRPVPTVTTSPAIDLVGDESDFPTRAQEYAESAVAAWSTPNLNRLAELATATVHLELLELPAPPQLGWRFIRCEPALDDTGCTFHNARGDHLVLTVTDTRLGQARAVTAATYDPASYPDDPVAYVSAFVTGWQTGNSARMKHLALPAAVKVFTQLPPTAQVDYRLGETTIPIVTVLVTLDDTELSVRVNQLLLGEPQAIRSAHADSDDS